MVYHEGGGAMSATLDRPRVPRRGAIDFDGAYDALRSQCTAIIRSRHSLNLDDADDVYQVAWVELWQFAKRGNTVVDPKAFVLDVMEKRWRDELRRGVRRHERSHDDIDGRVHRHDPPAESYDDRDQIRRAAEVLDTVLDDPQVRSVFYLTWFDGLTREQACRAVGLPWHTPTEKRLDRASKKIADKLGAVRAGDWCNHQRELMQDYAERRLHSGSEAHTLARKHLANCPACRHFVLVMRGMRILGPPPLLLVALTEKLGGEVAAATGASGAGKKAAKAGTKLAASGAGGGGTVAGGSLLGIAGAKVALFGTAGAIMVGGIGVATMSAFDERARGREASAGAAGAPVAAVRGFGDEREVAAVAPASVEKKRSPTRTTKRRRVKKSSSSSAAGSRKRTTRSATTPNARAAAATAPQSTVAPSPTFTAAPQNPTGAQTQQQSQPSNTTPSGSGTSTGSGNSSSGSNTSGGGRGAFFGG